MKTLDDILNGMEKAVSEDMPVSPVQWVEGAIKINALRGTLDNQIADFEAKLAYKEAKCIEDGKPQSTAKILVRGKYNKEYNEYLKAKAKSARIIEFLRLAKKRSMIDEINI